MSVKVGEGEDFVYIYRNVGKGKEQFALTVSVGTLDFEVADALV